MKPSSIWAHIEKLSMCSGKRRKGMNHAIFEFLLHLVMTSTTLRNEFPSLLSVHFLNQLGMPTRPLPTFIEHANLFTHLDLDWSLHQFDQKSKIVGSKRNRKIFYLPFIWSYYLFSLFCRFAILSCLGKNSKSFMELYKCTQKSKHGVLFSGKNAWTAQRGPKSTFRPTHIYVMDFTGTQSASKIHTFHAHTQKQVGDDPNS